MVFVPDRRRFSGVCRIPGFERVIAEEDQGDQQHNRDAKHQPQFRIIRHVRIIAW